VRLAADIGDKSLFENRSRRDEEADWGPENGLKFRLLTSAATKNGKGKRDRNQTLPRVRGAFAGRRAQGLVQQVCLRSRAGHDPREQPGPVG
jgi:hypothetical protein